MTAELNQWKVKHSFAEKELQGPCSHHAEAVKDPPAQSNEDKFDFHQLQEKNSEITEKLARLLDENVFVRQLKMYSRCTVDVRTWTRNCNIGP